MIFIVVPAYNEEDNIGYVIQSLFQNNFKNIVVVDDGSSDDTARVAFENGAIVLRHVINRGQGAALDTGNQFLKNSDVDLVVHFDADRQFNPKDISVAISLLKEKNLDIILGSRFLDNRSKIPFFKKHFIFPIGRLVNYIFTGVKLTDVHNGFRIISKKALSKIKINQDRMAHNSEIIAQIKKHNLNFGECPVEVVYYEYGQGIGGGIKIIRDLFLSKIIK